jgi:DNA-directed RNA polymerase subunit RPC12/RpoP
LGAREIPYKRFYTAVALEEKRRQILGRVEARGQISLDVLAFELDAPVELVKEWIYRLVQSRKFTGYINWDEGILYSADAEGLRDGGRCPYCGGSLGLAGKGIVRCHNCGSEIFL